LKAQGEKIVNNLKESRIKEADLKQTNAELNDQLEVDIVNPIQKLTYMNEFFFKTMKKRGDQVVNELRESKKKVADLEKSTETLNDLLEVNIVKSFKNLTHVNQ
jgi:hypothetical protein